MPYAVDFNDVSTVGLESSPVAAALAGLRAHEARYFKNKYDHVFTVEPASNAKTTIDWVHRILEEERDIVISSRPLEATAFQVENIRIAYVFYESGLSINVMYTIDDPKKRAVGFKLSEGMEVPAELASRFKFATQKSKLAGTIRGSYFAFENELLTAEPRFAPHATQRSRDARPALRAESGTVSQADPPADGFEGRPLNCGTLHAAHETPGLRLARDAGPVRSELRDNAA